MHAKSFQIQETTDRITGKRLPCADTSQASRHRLEELGGIPTQPQTSEPPDVVGGGGKLGDGYARSQLHPFTTMACKNEGLGNSGEKTLMAVVQAALDISNPKYKCV